MKELKKRFNKAVIGLSDHTKDNYCSYAALGLGASIIEKHFIDTKNRKGPDVSASMDTKNFKDLIEASIYASLNIMVLKNNKTRNCNLEIRLRICRKYKKFKKRRKVFKKYLGKRPGTEKYLQKFFLNSWEKIR